MYRLTQLTSTLIHSIEKDRIEFCAIFSGQVKSDEICVYLTVDMKEIIFDSYFVKFVAIPSMQLVGED